MDSFGAIYMIVSLPDFGFRDNQPQNLAIDCSEDFFAAKLLAREGIAKYETNTMATVLFLMKEIVENRVFFDVGANIGVYSFFLSSVLEGLSIFAFEPTPSLASVSRKIAKDNALSYRVEELAMGSSCGNALLHISEKTDCSNSLVEGFRKSSQSIEVRMETIDKYCQKNNVVPSVIKVDTEAFKPDVLLGCAETITSSRPWVICEVLAGRTEKKLMDVMKPHGYFYYHIDDSWNWRPKSEIVGDSSYIHRDWLLAPEPVHQGFVDGVRELANKMLE